jgi:hypothetical protein
MLSENFKVTLNGKLEGEKKNEVLSSEKPSFRGLNYAFRRIL